MHTGDPEEAPLTGDIEPREVKKEVLLEAETEIRELMQQKMIPGMEFPRLYVKYAPTLGHRRLGRLLSRIYVEEMVRGSSTD